MAYDALLSARLHGHRFELSLEDRTGRIANLHRVGADLVEAFKRAGRETALETRDIARELTPVDKGFMRDNLELYVSPDGQVFEVGWRAEPFFAEGLAFYPQFVVLGTRYQAPNDPLTPAHERTKPRYEQRIRANIAEAMRRRAVIR